MAGKQRISYVPLDAMTEEMRVEMDRCAREGTPRPESSAVRAHVPAAFWAFANSWRDLFHTGVCDHAIKELCRVYVSRSVKCEYCGNQRSVKGAGMGLVEGQYDELLNFESADGFDERRLRLDVEGGRSSKAPSRVAPGLYRFEVTAPKHSGGKKVELSLRFAQLALPLCSRQLCLLDH